MRERRCHFEHAAAHVRREVYNDHRPDHAIAINDRLCIGGGRVAQFLQQRLRTGHGLLTRFAQAVEQTGTRQQGSWARGACLVGIRPNHHGADTGCHVLAEFGQEANADFPADSN